MPTREEWRDWCGAIEKPKPLREATPDNPHTFVEAVQYLNAGNHIDYEVMLSGYHGALMTRKAWLEDVNSKSLIDYDGMGNEIDEHGNFLGVIPHQWEGEPRKSKLIAVGDPAWIKPSQARRIRPETKYILWYNR